jgi:DNA-binding MarR family transcriptional regulator
MDSVDVDQLSEAVRALVIATDRYSEAASAHQQLHRTDMRALAALMDAPGTGDDGLSPGRLGTRLGLSSPATTALVDRLERAGHVTRERDPRDRRVVIVRITEQALREGSALYTPLQASLLRALQQLDPADLAITTRTLRVIETATREATAVVEQDGVTAAT